MQGDQDRLAAAARTAEQDHAELAPTGGRARALPEAGPAPARAHRLCGPEGRRERLQPRGV